MNLDNVKDVYRLSPMQEGMLLHTVSQPESGMFVQQVCNELTGHIDPDVLFQAWEKVTRRFDALRTVYLWDGLDEPLQVVRERVEPQWTVMDWSADEPPGQQERLQELLTGDRRNGFQLSKAPIGRHHLIRFSESKWMWVWSFHHIQLDGWSTSIVLQEFLALCASITKPTIQNPGSQFHTFIDWQRQQDIEAAEHYWREHLAGFCQLSRLNIVNQSYSPTTNLHQQIEFSIGVADSLRFQEFARQNRITLNALIQGAWALLLSRYSGEDDIVYGSTIGGRPPALNGIERSVGMFINTLPVRLKATADTVVADWLTDVHIQLIKLQEWEFSPLEKVQTWSDIDAGQPLFENIVVFENYPIAAREDDSATFKITNTFHLEQSNYPFALLVVPGKQIRLIGVYGTSRFSEKIIQRILEQLNSLICSFVNNPNQVFGEIQLKKSELNWNTQTSASDAGNEQGIHQLFENQVQTAPTIPALAYGEKEWSYAELNMLAGRLQHQLQELGIRPSDRVGIHMNRSFEMIVAILGVLKAGAAYVPLDPDYPQAHLDFIAADSELSIVLTKSDTPVRLSDANIQTINLDSSLACVANKNTTTERPAEVTATDLAYVIYTSGSSGKAKGVPISHANIVSSTKAREEYYGKKSDRFLLLSSFAFDSSCASIFGALCTGGTLVLPEPNDERNMAKIERLIESQRISSLLCLPSLYSLILEHSETERLGSLQTVITAGEEFPAVLCRSHFEKLPAVRLFNEYGPTEATVWSTVYEVKPEDTSQTIPIGKPIANVEIMIADSHGQPAPPGVPGELLIGGPGITSGYLNQPQLTAASFVHQVDSTGKSLRMYKTGDLVVDPGDGNLLFLGRKDDQVKIRGYRIEPSAIEQTLCSHPAVREAVVVPISNETNNSLLQQMQALPPEQSDRLLSEVEGMLPHADPVTREPSL